MRILKSIFGAYVDKSYVKDAQTVLSICRSYGLTERNDLKVCTIMALAMLIADCENKENTLLHFALDTMDKGRKLSDYESGMLSSFRLELMSLQQQAFKSTSPFNNLIASGMPIWITSIRALTNVSVLPYARELWAILQDSDDLRVRDQLDHVAFRLHGHPIAVILPRLHSFETPNLFVPR